MTSELATSKDAVSFEVNYRGEAFPMNLSCSCTVLKLGAELECKTGASLSTQKLILPTSKNKRSRPAVKPSDEDSSTTTLAELGIQGGSRLMLTGVTVQELKSLNQESEQAEKFNARTRGFEAELRRERRRRADGTGSKTDGTGPPGGQYTFGSYKVLEARAGRELTPPETEAKQLLYRLASDPGIVGIMHKHKWAVGELTEMPPEGKVGVSAVCLLGYNRNQGQEISLRLRTDDMKGFRKYDVIIKTLLHELAHMVWSEHDNNFKSLDSQLNKEYNSIHSHRQGGSTVSGSAPAEAAEFAHNWDQDGGYDSDDAMTATKASSGSKLGRAIETSFDKSMDPREAARLASIMRLSAATAPRPPPPPPLDGAPQLPPSLFQGCACGCSTPCLECTPAMSSNDDLAAADTDMAEADAAAAGADADVAEADADMAPRGIGSVPSADDVMVGDEERCGGVEEGSGKTDDTKTSSVQKQIGEEEREGGAGGTGGLTQGAEAEATSFIPSSSAPWSSGRGGTTHSVGGGSDDRDVSQDGMVEEVMFDDPVMAEMQAAAAAVGHKARAGVEEVVSRSSNFDDAEKCLSTVITILSNVVQQPDNEKFRFLRWGNNAIKRRIQSQTGAVNVLKTAGFVEVQGDSDPGLRLKRDDPGLIRIVLDTVQVALASVQDMSRAQLV
mmetsp:Transcript_26867/g.32621  ORF Transcript_26867/g.32621 Transcript_26867/m.32621 type:complete len:671 (+) Transcript_26867:207-2219(+)|eukprot:CAMPEP_0197859124 /NCGR_PEP_ID=MMETSP1438-20131217/33482_1 /TAXON_ID=1461541 /ORGANISM="Pterosperma sp., Strain CCMP1384" /LENGTH=670 /DNA_ID=CAMNT_0043475529 /DNA_START=207 /DNA_END=2219 /DNA_ORIENTATION=+